MEEEELVFGADEEECGEGNRAWVRMPLLVASNKIFRLGEARRRAAIFVELLYRGHAVREVRDVGHDEHLQWARREPSRRQQTLRG